MNAQDMLFCFVIAVLGCGACYLFLMSCVLKIEGGTLYVPSQIPWGATDEPHRRARRTLLCCAFVLSITIGLSGYLLSEWLAPQTWHYVGRPFMIGGLYAMVYTVLMKSDTVRPRAD